MEQLEETEDFSMNGYKQQYTCLKCANHTFEQDQFQATGGDFSKFFNVQNKKYITISCAQCGYTELYKAQTSTGMNILDFLLNGWLQKNKTLVLFLFKEFKV